MPQPRPPRDTWDDQSGLPAHPGRRTSGITSSIPSSWASTTSRRTPWRNAGSCCARRCDRCRMSAWRTCRRIRRGSASQDWTGPYQRHRRNLQLIGLNEPGHRWVLKNPSHLFALDAILAVYPDALIIQTHREPRAVIGSMCSLAAHATDGWSADVPRRGDRQRPAGAMGARAGGVRCCQGALRPGAVPGHRLRGVHRRPGSAPSSRSTRTSACPTAAPRRTPCKRCTPRPRTVTARPAHQYALADFGLTAEQVDERFAGLPASPAAIQNLPMRGC